ncbi:pentatricopeptide repeat-containing protein [Senna tora]|uniref:Pentatricopeptide repeat-containing protein n=1 Tax=Senna tora TaxID=362788 RepID=A0A834TSM1_9FABA|nr:pentatricopeptide repeat-containing protein [Senna tora]
MQTATTPSDADFSVAPCSVRGFKISNPCLAVTPPNAVPCFRVSTLLTQALMFIILMGILVLNLCSVPIRILFSFEFLSKICLGLSQGVDFSINLFREMRDLGFQPTVVTYNTVIRLLCDNFRYKDALVMLDTMRNDGCQPNAISYQFFFTCIEKPGEILNLFDRMVESGVRPSMETYVMLMRKFGRWGFLRPVFIMWKKMEELGCSPNASTYNALIDALVEKGLIDIARKYD